MVGRWLSRYIKPEGRDVKPEARYVKPEARYVKLEGRFRAPLELVPEQGWLSMQHLWVCTETAISLPATTELNPTIIALLTSAVLSSLLFIFVRQRQSSPEGRPAC